MLKLGALVLDRSRPIVAVPFTDGAAAKTIRRALTLGMDVAELRVDLFSHTRREYVVAEARKFAAIPTLATIRCRREGGHWVRSERDRLALFRAVVPYVSGVDIELGSSDILPLVMQTVHRAGKTVVVSFHDFSGTPPYHALLRRVRQAENVGADLIKIATYAPNDQAVSTLARLLVEHPQRSLVVLAMGPVGVKSRIFFPALGSLMTFASLQRATAPGQVGLRETVQELAAYYPGFRAGRALQVSAKR
jgi:3-dehydroquinate dehydratase-1